MVDNVAITAGTGVTVAADDIGAGVLAQRVKPVWGPDGTGNDVDVASGKAMPVQLRSPTGVAPVVTAASTAPIATDTALVVAISPNSVNANGSAAAANSAPVTSSTEDVARVGIITETAPASDTASSGLNGRLQRIAQRLTTALSGIPIIPATSGGLSRSRTLVPNNTTAVVVKGTAGQVYKIRATNNSTTIAYIKLYDAASATAGSGTPVDTIMIPAATTGGAGIVDTTDIGVAHATGITFIVTTGIADNDTTAPAANAYIVTMYYK